MLVAKAYRINHFLCLAILLLLSLCAEVAAGESVSVPVELNEHINGLPLGTNMLIFEDKTSEITIQDILNPNSTYAFVRSTESVPGFGYTDSVYWLKLEILNTDENQEDWLLEVPYAPLDRIDVYFVESNGARYIEKLAGDSVRYENRDVEYHHAVFHLPRIPADPQVVYLRVKSESSMQLPVVLWSSSAFTTKIVSEMLMWGGYFGCLVIMGIYNLLLFASIRERVYAVYAFYVFSMVAFQLTILGFSSKYIWPDYPSITNMFIICSLNAIGFFAALFSKDFLRLDRHSKVLNGIVNVTLAGFVLGILVFNFLSYEAMLKFTTISISFGIFLLIWSGFYCWNRGYQAARIYLFAWLSLLVGALLYALKTMGFVPSNIITNYAVIIGSTAEVMLLSLALGDRINQEIQSKNQAQKSSIANLQKYEELYEGAIEGLFQYSLRDKSIKCNIAMANLCGFDNVSDFIRSDYWKGLSKAASYQTIEKSLFKSGELQNKEILIENEFLEEPKWCSSTMKIFNDATGRPDRIEGSLIDISERKLKEKAQDEIFLAQEQLLLVREEALSNLHKADDLKDAFLATLSHELRTPMNGILGCIQLLEGQHGSPEAKEAYSGLEKSSAEMIGLVNRLLDFTEIQSGNYELQEKNFSLSQLMEPVVYLSKIRCKEKGLTFNLNIVKDTPDVFFGDQEKVLLLLENLIENAIKFTNAGSVSVTINSERLERPASVKNKNIILRISIMDTGIGISREAKSEIFSMFTQAECSIDRSYGGLGLGLSLCKRYIELMGGELNFTTEQGKGSEFFCSVPLKLMPAGTTLPEKMLFQSAVREASILVVEDNKTNQLVLLGILKKLGHSTEVANDGAEALALLACKKFDLILMDCQMPVMDGLEATRQIRRNNQGSRNIPIIAITANAMSGDRQRCLTAGMNDYIKKPFKKEILNEKINLWLQHLVSNCQGVESMDKASSENKKGFPSR